MRFRAFGSLPVSLQCGSHDDGTEWGRQPPHSSLEAPSACTHQEGMQALGQESRCAPPPSDPTSASSACYKERLGPGPLCAPGWVWAKALGREGLSVSLGTRERRWRVLRDALFSPLTLRHHESDLLNNWLFPE
jgi:hypothetical protein